MESTQARVRRLTGDFFMWWFGELRAMLPKRLTALFTPPVNELALELTKNHLVLRRTIGEADRELGSLDVDLEDPGASRAAVQAILADANLEGATIALGLPSSLALRRVVDLPSAADENLRQVIAFEMDRLTPFAADAVHYDVHLLARDQESRRIKVELLVLPRGAVDPAVETLRGLGFEPEVVSVSRKRAGTPPWRVPLAVNGNGRSRFALRLSIVLLVVAAVLAIVGVDLALDRDRAWAARLADEVAATRREAEEGRQLEAQIDALGSQGNFILDRKKARPPVVEVLAELSRVMPDDTWLYRLRLINQELQTFGYSPNASVLIGLLENSSLFSSAQFRAPLTRDQRIDAEQFHIAFQVARENPQ